MILLVKQDSPEAEITIIPGYLNQVNEFFLDESQPSKEVIEIHTHMMLNSTAIVLQKGIEEYGVNRWQLIKIAFFYLKLFLLGFRKPEQKT
jgi:hypothetical protein